MGRRERVTVQALDIEGRARLMMAVVHHWPGAVLDRMTAHAEVNARDRTASPHLMGAGRRWHSRTALKLVDSAIAQFECPT